MLIMHTVLGATASSRLFMNLREEKGYTYGAYSNLDARTNAGTFRATAEVRTPVTGDSLKEFFFELERIRNDRVSEKEINDAKSYLTGVFPIRLETQEGMIDQLVQIKMLGLPDDYFQNYRERVQAVTIDDVQRVAAKYVRPDQAAIVVVGDGAKVMDQISPYCEDIEAYTTSGKRKTRLTRPLRSILLVPGQLILKRHSVSTFPRLWLLREAILGLRARISSEMGDADLGAIDLRDNSFTSSTKIETDGHAVDIQIYARFEGEQTEGSVTLQDSPSLPFEGTRE